MPAFTCYLRVLQIRFLGTDWEDVIFQYVVAIVLVYGLLTLYQCTIMFWNITPLRQAAIRKEAAVWV